MHPMALTLTPAPPAAPWHLLSALFEVQALSALSEGRGQGGFLHRKGPPEPPRPPSKFLEIILSSFGGPGRWGREKAVTQPSSLATKEPFRSTAKVKHR